LSDLVDWNLYQQWIGESSGRVNLIAQHYVPMLEGITEAICRLNHKYPNKIGTTTYQKYWIKTVCVPPLLEPKPDILPFTGGQCPLVAYTAKIRLKYVDAITGNPAQEDATLIRSATGKITDIRVAKGTLDNGTPFWFLYIIDQANPPTPPEPLSGVFVNISIVDIALDRNDGQPDNCGDLPGQKPPDEPFNSDDLCFTIDDIKFCIPNDDTIKPPFCFYNDGAKICIGDNGLTGEDKPPDKLTWVLITVTKEPDKGKIILQDNPNLNDFFAGYLCFKVNVDGIEHYLPPVPIRKKRNAYPVPDGLTKYLSLIHISEPTRR
jgi:hypothetical protein